MKWFSSYRVNWMLVGIVGAIIVSGGHTRADFVFGEPTNLGPVVNSSAWDQKPCISADGLSLYFGSDRFGGQGDTDLWMTTRESVHDDWGTTVNLGAPVNSSRLEWPCYISADGLELYFNDAGYNWGYVPRPGGQGETDLWVSTRPTRDHAWGEPVNLGPMVNSSANDCWADLSADGLTLYFDSDRHGRLDVDYQIWVTTRATKHDPWGEPVKLNINNEAAWEGNPSISSDDLALFFCANFSDSYGSGDIYMTTRGTRDDPWGTPVNLGPMVNTAYAEDGPDISADGRTLYFCDYKPPRPGGYGATDLWQVSIDPIVDFNGDRIVDAEDMCIMVDHWGEDYPLCDIGPTPWGDGVVDVEDLIVLAEHLFEQLPGRPINP